MRRYRREDVSFTQYRNDSHHLGPTNSFTHPSLILLCKIRMGSTVYFAHLGDEGIKHGRIHGLLKRVDTESIERIFELSLFF